MNQIMLEDSNNRDVPGLTKNDSGVGGRYKRKQIDLPFSEAAALKTDQVRKMFGEQTSIP